MKIYLGNNFAKIELDVLEVRQGIIREIKDAFSCNEEVTRWEKKRGREFDPESEEDLKDMIEFTRIEVFQNWCCHQLTGKKYNPYVWDDVARKKGKNFIRMWDGWRTVVKNVGRKGNEIKIRSGLLKNLIMFLQSEDIENEYGEFDIEIIDERKNKIELTSEPVYNSGKFSLWDNQVPVIEETRRTLLDQENYGQYFTHVLWDLAVNSGKTVLAAVLVRNIKDARIIMPFRNQKLMIQTVGDMIELGFWPVIICPKPVEREIKKSVKARNLPLDYLQGAGYANKSLVTICMIPTIEARVKRGVFDMGFFDRFSVGLFDECEGLTSPQSLQFLDRLKLGLWVGYSGTPLKSESALNRLTVLGLFGSQRYKISVAENIGEGRSLKPEVHFYLNNFWDQYEGESIRETKELFIYRGTNRARIIHEFFEENPGIKTVIYYGHAKLEYGDWIAGYFSEFTGFGAEHSNGTDKHFQDKVQRFREGKLPILVVNSIAKRGLNIPEIECFVNWETTDNEISTVQAVIGRSIRKGEGQDRAIIIDFYDHGHPHFERNSQNRIKLYRDEEIGADLIFHYPNKNGIPIFE